MADRLRALIVEDSEDDTEMLLRHLRRADLEVEWLRVETPDAMRAALQQRRWDVVLSDYSMPRFSAPAAAALLREEGLDIPFIIVSGTIGEETAVTALKAGAHDFMTKGNLSRLIPAIERELKDAEERHRRREVEHALTDMRERMRFALEAVEVGTWEWDILTGSVVWSDMQERLHGLAPGSFRGTIDAFYDLVHPDDHRQLQGIREMFLASQGHSWVEYRVKWRDGSVHWIASTGRGFRDEAGRPVRAAGIGVDITERRRLEQQLLQAQKMESIGNLAGGIAHDFNNLLTAIAGYCQLLQERSGLEAGMLGDLNEIRLAVDRAAALTRQLLAFGRRQVLAPRIVSLNDVVADIAPMLRRLIEESVQIDLHLAQDLAAINVDPSQMEQVVLNLAVNARDAMPQGGKLTIETANAELDNAYAQTHGDVRPGPHVMLSVSDTGHGMTPEVQARIFDPFFSTKSPGHGTGLGLATVYGIVKQSGGHIFVYSEPGLGTTFRLYFPVAVDAPRPAALPAKDVDRDLSGSETILVVEDDPRLRALDERILKRYGYHVLVAADVEGAMRVCTEHRGPIHVVLTDVVMPGGSGRNIGDWVLEHRPETKVMYMSGYADTAIVHHGVLDPGTHFLQKPFSPAELARKVRSVLS
ncbi:MAG: response regulator [Acidobacteria bacterium]|nr:response regulator [Acidobacteriota bacterium]